jgi:hypothetical protein
VIYAQDTLSWANSFCDCVLKLAGALVTLAFQASCSPSAGHQGAVRGQGDGKASVSPNASAHMEGLSLANDDAGQSAPDDRETLAMTAAAPLDRDGNSLPAQCTKALELIEYLALRCGADGAFEAQNCKPIEMDTVLSKVAESGVQHFDVNGYVTNSYSSKQLRAQLVARRGKAFEAIAHLGYAYWSGPHSAGVSCHHDETEISIRLADDEYRLVFTPDYLLTRIEYLVTETE